MKQKTTGQFHSAPPRVDLSNYFLNLRTHCLLPKMACIATERSDIGDRSHRAEVGDRRLAFGLRIFLRNVAFNGKFVLSSYEYVVPVHPIR
jgi:hypothetical protein